jgi:hypothetical protein
VQGLDLPSVQDTLGMLLKYQDDIETVQRGELKHMIDEACERAALSQAAAEMDL